MRTTAAASFVLFLLLAACGGESTKKAPHGSTDAAAAWGATIAFEAGVKLGGCAVGDIDPLHEGNEIAAVAVDGRVFLVHLAGGKWEGAEILRVPGEMIQCAIGDADPHHPGNELVIAGMAAGTEDSGGEGAAYLVRRQDGAWRSEEITKDAALIHGACIGDLDTRYVGDEVATVGFSKRIRVFHREAGGWVETWRHDLPAPGKTAAMLGGMAVVANTSHEVCGYERVLDPDGPPGALQWHVVQRSLGATGVAQARIATDGERLLVACDDGTLQLLDGDEVTVLHREGAKLRGAVLADLDPSVPGIEAATAGYEKTLTLLYPPRGGEPAWKPLTLWRDTDRLHHLAAGELDAQGTGFELVAVGYSGRVIVASRKKR